MFAEALMEWGFFLRRELASPDLKLYNARKPYIEEGRQYEETNPNFQVGFWQFGNNWNEIEIWSPDTDVLTQFVD